MPSQASLPKCRGAARLCFPAFLKGLEQLGWRDGRNVRIERRSAMGIPERQYAAEMVALAPDIIVTSGTSVGPLL